MQRERAASGSEVNAEQDDGYRARLHQNNGRGSPETNGIYTDTKLRVNYRLFRPTQIKVTLNMILFFFYKYFKESQHSLIMPAILRNAYLL